MDSKDVVQAGVDANSHTTNLHQAVAQPLSEVQEVSVNPEQLAPTTPQTPLKAVTDFMEKAAVDLDLEDLRNTEVGAFTVRTNTSGNFLSKFWERLRKIHPNATIKDGS